MPKLRLYVGPLALCPAWSPGSASDLGSSVLLHSRVIERPPYADFLQGYVGIPANPDVVGSDAAVAGTVVLTTTGSKHVKAHKIEISLVKIESLPGSAAQQQRYKKSIATQVLWSRRGQGDLPKEVSSIN